MRPKPPVNSQIQEFWIFHKNATPTPKPGPYRFLALEPQGLNECLIKKRIGLIGCGNLGYRLAYYIGQLDFDALYVHDLDQEKAGKLKRDIAKIFPSVQVKDYIGTDQLDVIVLSLDGLAATVFIMDPQNHTAFQAEPGLCQPWPTRP